MTTDANEVLDVIVVGAGISGLVCARELVAGGRRVLLLDKSRGLGGRCATRRMLGQPVDIGLSYYHGDDPQLLAELARVPATLLSGWPRQIAGTGPPCHPAALRPGQQRLAFAEGVNAFPRHLARDLDVRLGARVQQIVPESGAVTLQLEDGSPLRARDVVLTTPPPQARAILAGQQSRSSRAVLGLLEHVVVEPCITMTVGYSLDSPDPGFDLLYPDRRSVIQLISHDSSKRVDPTYRVLVVQARAAWSRQHLEASQDEWRAALLAEAAAQLGPWVHTPAWSDLQRWRFAKTGHNTELGAPMVLGLPRRRAPRTHQRGLRRRGRGAGGLPRRPRPRAAPARRPGTARRVSCRPERPGAFIREAGVSVDPQAAGRSWDAGTYRIATAPEPTGCWSTRRRSRCLDSPASRVGPWPATRG